MVINKETLELRYYELWDEIKGCTHDKAVAALAGETGLPVLEIVEVLSEGVAA